MLSTCNREAIVAAAQSWIDTPYHHLACLKGVGVDCVHLLIGVAKEVGLLQPSWQCPYYTPGWHLHQQSDMLAETLQQLGCHSQAQALPSHGDIVTFRMAPEQSPSHAGIAVRMDADMVLLIHAVYGHAVRCHRLHGYWLARLAEVYTFPGMAL